ncbi:hypothetical protein C8T65DRAFT_691696 [Cerioporus squamosus]|nr:hypothetical protein C8T65DRAFT_691696 [Cerioporus squamosus]
MSMHPPPQPQPPQPSPHYPMQGATHPLASTSTLGVRHAPEDSDQDTPQKKQKRRRQALSCTECKRRKIKCDRANPCGPCVRRGEQSKCQWHIIEPLEKYVSRAEFDELKTRVEQLEAMVLRGGPSTSSPTAPISRRASPPPEPIQGTAITPYQAYGTSGAVASYPLRPTSPRSPVRGREPPPPSGYVAAPPLPGTSPPISYRAPPHASGSRSPGGALGASTAACAHSEYWQWHHCGRNGLTALAAQANAGVTEPERAALDRPSTAVVDFLGRADEPIQHRPQASAAAASPAKKSQRADESAAGPSSAHAAARPGHRGSVPSPPYSHRRHPQAGPGLEARPLSPPSTSMHPHSRSHAHTHPHHHSPRSSQHSHHHTHSGSSADIPRPPALSASSGSSSSPSRASHGDDDPAMDRSAAPPHDPA